MVVGIVGELEDVRRRGDFGGRGIAVLGGILLHYAVCVGADILALGATIREEPLFV